MTADVQVPARTSFRRVLGDELRKARKQCGWTRRGLQERLAPISLVSMQTLATYELGTRGIALERFIELCAVLEVSAPDLLARTIQRTTGAEPAGRLPVDLRAVVRDLGPALFPLRRWAGCRLSTTPEDQPAVVHLDPAALEPMAELCGTSIPDLTAALHAVAPNPPMS